MTRTETALSRLNNQFFDSSNLRDFITAVFTAVEDSDALIEYLQDNRSLEDAEGVWLDNVGKIVGIERPLEEIGDTHYFELWDTTDDPTLNRMFVVGDDLGPAGYIKGINTRKSIYFFPYTKDENILRYDKWLENWTKIGDPIYSQTLPNFANALEGPDGMIYGLPGTTPYLYQVNPKTDEVTEIGMAPTAIPWKEGKIVGDRIYFLPYFSEYFGYYDTVTGEYAPVVGSALPSTSGHEKTAGGVVVNDRYIYVAPFEVDYISYFIKFDTLTNDWEYVGDEITTWNPLYTQLIVDLVDWDQDTFFALPAFNDKFIRFDTTTDTWIREGSDLTGIYDPSDGKRCFSGGFVNGFYIYCVPYDADSFIEMDPDDSSYWEQYGDLFHPSPQFEPYRWFVDDSDLGFRFTGYSTFYGQVWESDIDETTDWFTHRASGVFNYGAFAGSYDHAILLGITGTGSVQKYVPEYLRGLSNVDQLEGGCLRSIHGTWLDEVTYVNDEDYFVLIDAKAKASFVGSTLHSVAKYVYDAFGITSEIVIIPGTDGDWGVNLDGYLGAKEQRYLLLYAPVPAGSTIEITDQGV